jgi:hypothetical protein
MQMQELFSFSSSQVCTVAQAASLQNLHDIFHTPFSEEAYQQYNLLNQELQEISLSHDKDLWTYIWGSANFSVQKAYQSLSGSLPTHPALKLLWKTKCQPKHRVFFWLLLQDN